MEAERRNRSLFWYSKSLNQLNEFFNLMNSNIYYEKQVIYLNPTGANPTGVSISLERRREIYKICQEFDLLIFEDDPYFFLQYEQVKISNWILK